MEAVVNFPGLNYHLGINTFSPLITTLRPKMAVIVTFTPALIFDQRSLVILSQLEPAPAATHFALDRKRSLV